MQGHPGMRPGFPPQGYPPRMPMYRPGPNTPGMFYGG